MIAAFSPRRRLVLPVIIVLGLAVVLLAGVGIYGLLATPEEDSEQQSTPIHSGPAADRRIALSGESDEDLLSWENLPTLPQTDDPLTYAKAVARSVLAWDTMSGLSPEDYANPVLIDADPTGAETNGLISDLDNYLPPEEVWLQLREYETTQWLTIDNAYVPDTWTRIFQDNSNRLTAGTVAVTIDGTRHRAGTWLGEPQTSKHDEAFTVFLACPPAYDRCHTLRLSEPGNALR